MELKKSDQTVLCVYFIDSMQVELRRNTYIFTGCRTKTLVYIS